MHFPYNKMLMQNARDMRKNMTPEEDKLWYQCLSNHQYRFLRQKVIGNFILDFYCPKAKIGIELDGNQHLSKSAEEKDALRSGRLSAFGIDIIRFSNDQIKYGFDSVCRQIDVIIKERLDKGNV